MRWRHSASAPGDVVIVNDPFRGGTHLPDITAVSGVFTGQKQDAPISTWPIAAHHADVGGMSPGSMPLAREIYQEGLRIPPVLLMKGGKVQRDVMQIILANVRTPEEREGDLMAQVMSNRRGEDRLLRNRARYGLRARAAQRGGPAGLQRARDARDAARDPGWRIPVRRFSG